MSENFSTRKLPSPHRSVIGFDPLRYFRVPVILPFATVTPVCIFEVRTLYTFVLPVSAATVTGERGVTEAALR